MSSVLRATHIALFAVLGAELLASAATAAERELDDAPPPSSVREIKTPIQRVTPEEKVRPSLIPGLRKRLQNLPPFLADTQLEARYRTYYLHQHDTTDDRREAWAMGGSIRYQSGWLAETFAVEVEGFTSQPIVAPNDRDGTLLLAPEQEGYTVLGIANGKLRWRDFVLTGYRQYLDLPYLNRRDNRMTPNTFESLVLKKTGGALRFSGGYTWKIKRRNDDDFESMTRFLGLDVDRGLAHFGAVWDPDEDHHIGAIGVFLPDVGAGLYAESGFGFDLLDGVDLRFDGQFTYEWEEGRDLLGDTMEDTWNLGLRASTSYRGALFRLGFSITGPDSDITHLYGTSPSYVDLMQRTFNRADEKALLASASYDFGEIGLAGLTAILNFAAGFDGKRLGVRSNSQEIDLTLDYKIKSGWLESFWLRVRASWLNEEVDDRDGTDVRVILRYDFPIL